MTLPEKAENNLEVIDISGKKFTVTCHNKIERDSWWKSIEHHRIASIDAEALKSKVGRVMSVVTFREHRGIFRKKENCRFQVLQKVNWHRFFHYFTYVIRSDGFKDSAPNRMNFKKMHCYLLILVHHSKHRKM